MSRVERVERVEWREDMGQQPRRTTTKKSERKKKRKGEKKREPTKRKEKRMDVEQITDPRRDKREKEKHWNENERQKMQHVWTKGWGEAVILRRTEL